MKKNLLYLSLLLSWAVLFTSCSENEPEKPGPPVDPNDLTQYVVNDYTVDADVTRYERYFFLDQITIGIVKAGDNKVDITIKDMYIDGTMYEVTIKDVILKGNKDEVTFSHSREINSTDPEIPTKLSGSVKSTGEILLDATYPSTAIIRAIKAEGNKGVLEEYAEHIAGTYGIELEVELEESGGIPGGWDYDGTAVVKRLRSQRIELEIPGNNIGLGEPVSFKPFTDIPVTKAGDNYMINWKGTVDQVDKSASYPATLRGTISEAGAMDLVATIEISPDPAVAGVKYNFIIVGEKGVNEIPDYAYDVTGVELNSYSWYCYGDLKVVADGTKVIDASNVVFTVGKTAKRYIFLTLDFTHQGRRFDIHSYSIECAPPLGDVQLSYEGAFFRFSAQGLIEQEVKDEDGNPVLDEDGNVKTEKVPGMIQNNVRTKATGYGGGWVAGDHDGIIHMTYEFTFEGKNYVADLTVDTKDGPDVSKR